MATKKLKPDEEAITEILVADTDSESGADVSDGGGGDGDDDDGGGGGGGDEEEDEQQQQEEQQQLLQQASAQDKPQAAASGRGLPPWGPPQGRNTNVHPFIGPA